MRKILYISGTRADYGLMRSVLKEIDEHFGGSIKQDNSETFTCVL